MKERGTFVTIGLALGVALVAACAPARGPATGPAEARPPKTLRIATYNIRELSREKVDSVTYAGVAASAQLLAAAEVIRNIRPDILVLNEVDLGRSGYYIDTDDPEAVVRAFRDRYLEVGPAPVHYPFYYAAISNTGVLSGLDLNGDGIVATPAHEGTREHGDDAFGFGRYPGQYSIAVLSRFPLAVEEARTFRTFLWRDLPGHHMPEEFYDETARSVLRLSSKSHVDLPVALDRDTLHLLLSHPTPPVFDGPENRNGRRNFDEIGFWAAYLNDAEGLYDDRGRRGGYDHDDPFVIAGDLNAAPFGGDAVLDDRAAISQLFDHPRIRRPEILALTPTAVFGEPVLVDYLLPSRDVEVLRGGVFAPPGQADPKEEELAARASDHRLVWLDIQVSGR